MNWLATVWSQLFRAERLIAPERFLQANLTLGLFAIVVLVAEARHPERSSLLFTALVLSTVVTHVGGAGVVLMVKGTLERTVFVQGVCLFATTACLVTTAVWLTLHAVVLSDVRYLPGIASSLSLQASLEVEFFGPAWLRSRTPA